MLFDEEKKAFGELIKKLRLERQWSRKKLSYESNISVGQIKLIEEKDCPINYITLHTICSLFGALEVEMCISIDKKSRCR